MVEGARRALARRLLADSARPLAVALSGGGDSLALTLMADAWARQVGRQLLILTVDHRLQADSRVWTERCAALAQRLSRPFRALAWEGDKPATGLPAAARAARHRLLADAARAAGARVILMGHTADDLLEAAAMRAAGATTPDPREWAPSPAWPEGRGLFVLRPLLDVRRATLREWLSVQGETWIDDPANQDPRYARSRARRASGTTRSCDRVDPAPLDVAGRAAERHGVITVARRDLAGAAPDEARRFIALASVCAGGGDRRPAAARIAALAGRLRGEHPFVATLAGARIEADESTVRVFREPGDMVRAGLRRTPLKVGEEMVWDGRFLLIDRAADARRLAGLARRLPPLQQRELRMLPAAARGALPALVDADGRVSCPALSGAAVSLVGARLIAAAGLVTSEPL